MHFCGFWEWKIAICSCHKLVKKSTYESPLDYVTNTFSRHLSRNVLFKEWKKIFRMMISSFLINDAANRPIFNERKKIYNSVPCFNFMYRGQKKEKKNENSCQVLIASAHFTFMLKSIIPFSIENEKIWREKSWLL